MKLSDELIKNPGKIYEPSCITNMQFKGKDLAFKADEEGRPILLFIGELTGAGTIKGERYACRLAVDSVGKVIKDHWELKGKST